MSYTIVLTYGFVGVNLSCMVACQRTVVANVNCTSLTEHVERLKQLWQS